MSDKWREAMTNTRLASSGKQITAMRILIRYYPSLAEIVLDRSIETDSQDNSLYRINFDFIEDPDSIEDFDQPDSLVNNYS